MTDIQETEVLAMAPGQMLRRAREGKNLTVAAIATLMNLDLRTIEALEAGDQAKLPAPIFVRGYLRGYARLVGVTEDMVLHAYKAHAPQEPMPRSVGMSRVPMRPAFRAQMIPWKAVFSAILVLLLVWLGVQWWPEIDARMQGLETQNANSSSASDETPIEQTLTEPVDSGSAVLADFLESDIPQAESNAVELSLPAPQPVPLAEQPPPPAQVEPENLPSDTDFATRTDDTQAQFVAPVAGPDEVRLELKLNDDSWVEVRAADGNSLLLGLLRKGDTRSVTGKAPLSIVLGNAAGVEVQVDGKAFAHDRHSNNNIARFEIKR